MTANEADFQAKRYVGWVHEHSRAVRGYLFGMTRRADAADDLLQEVFQRAWKARATYAENGHARAYLLKIADRLVCDRNRKARPEITLDAEQWKKCDPPSGVRDPTDEFDLREETAQLHKALHNLSPIQRRVLLLRYYGQMSFAEIAAETGCRLNTVLSHCRRGLETLRTIMVEESK
jgi:RNA polymerase sigma-70 factor (ECF subfamily)